jgi:hypothetical protein
MPTPTPTDPDDASELAAIAGRCNWTELTNPGTGQTERILVPGCGAAISGEDRCDCDTLESQLRDARHELARLQCSHTEVRIEVVRWASAAAIACAAITGKRADRIHLRSPEELVAAVYRRWWAQRRRRRPLDRMGFSPTLSRPARLIHRATDTPGAGL